MTEPALAPDAAIALGIAATAMPFAGSVGAEAERWLRILRVHGEAGAALSALGVSEAPLDAPDEHESRSWADDDNRDATSRVTAEAERIATRRGVNVIGTDDLLLAVMHVYGADFDRVLQAHGTDRDEVLERLDPPGSAAP